MKKILLVLSLTLITMCLFAICANAVKIGEIDYTLTKGETEAENTAQIGNHKNKKFTNTEIFIPEYIEYEGEKYYVTSVANFTFELTNVTRIEFADNSRVKDVANGFAKYCSSLEYVKLHDGIERIGGEAFIGCGKMKLASNFLPSSLCNEIGTYAFKNCSSLDSVLVFPEGFTSFTNDSGIQATPVNTLVFKGAMTDVHMRYFGKLNIYFANNSASDLNGNFVATQLIDNKPYYTVIPAEKINGNNYTQVTGKSLTIHSFSSTGVNSASGIYTDENGDKIAPVNANQDKLYFCKDDKIVYLVRNSNTTGGWTAFLAPFDTVSGDTTYLRDPHISGNAEFEDDSCYAAYRCVACDTVIKRELSVDAPGHQAGDIIAIELTNGYFGTSVNTVKCSKCDIEYTCQGEALFVKLGYSCKTFGETKALVQGYKINKEEINDYKSVNADFEIGFVATVNQNGESFVPDFDNKNVLSAPVSLVNDYIEIMVSGISKENTNIQIVLCLYVKDGEKLYFLDDGKVLESVTGISYDEAMNV